jgi:class 3 adenylate cyclase
VLPAIQTQTLVLHSSRSRLLPPEHGRYIAENITGARYVEIVSEDAALLFGAADQALDVIEEFLTGSRRPSEPNRMLATVMFTDLVGSTSRLVAVGDREWRDTLERHDAITRSSITAWGGRVWKSTGDGVLASFDAPGRGIRCALSLRRALAEAGLEIRVGLHAGEVEIRDDDLSGLTVHIAARVLGAAGEGGVVVSRTMADLVAGSDLSLRDLGEYTFKGVPGEWRLFRVEE